MHQDRCGRRDQIAVERHREVEAPRFVRSLVPEVTRDEPAGEVRSDHEDVPLPRKVRTAAQVGAADTRGGMFVEVFAEHPDERKVVRELTVGGCL